jgi:choline dehydrogenase-like flavoprotein
MRKSRPANDPYSDENEDFITIPGLAGNGIGSRYDWNLSFAPNEALNGRVENLGQGKVVGGTSKINIMTFDRGSRSDYDRWEALGSYGWNWDSMLEYFIKVWHMTSRY